MYLMERYVFVLVRGLLCGWDGRSLAGGAGE